MTRRGQTTVEYAVFFVILCAAILGMSVYIKRGLSGRMREAADSMGQQYGPGETTSDFTTSFTSTSLMTSVVKKDQDVDGNGVVDGSVMAVTTKLEEPEVTSRSGSEDVAPE